MIQNRKERFRRKVGFTNAEITAIPNPTNLWVETLGSTVSENDISDKDFQGGRIIHNWFDLNDLKQKYVNYAYKLWGWGFVYLIECENWNRNPNIKVWDRVWYAYWLCQLNDKYQKDILNNTDYKTNRARQVEECYTKYLDWTPFYWRNRIIKGKKCYEYVKDRFTYIE